MHSDTISAIGGFTFYLILNLCCVLGLRACFSKTFPRFGLTAVARGYSYMVVFSVAAGALYASEVSNIAGDIIAQLLVLLPWTSTVVLLACLLFAWRGWLTFRVLAAAALLGLAYLALVNGFSTSHFGAVIIGASLAFALGFKHGERRHLDIMAETNKDG